MTSETYSTIAQSAMADFFSPTITVGCASRVWHFGADCIGKNSNSVLSGATDLTNHGSVVDWYGFRH